MRDSMEFDTVPYEETCEQVGPNYNPVKARNEANVTIQQVIRQFGEPPYGCFIKVKRNNHDFGEYLSISIVFDDNDADAVNYAYEVEANWPANFDTESRKALGIS